MLRVVSLIEKELFLPEEPVLGKGSMELTSIESSPQQDFNIVPNFCTLISIGVYCSMKRGTECWPTSGRSSKKRLYETMLFGQVFVTARGNNYVIRENCCAPRYFTLHGSCDRDRKSVV